MGKTKSVLWKRKSQGLLKTKATTLLKFLARIVIDSDARREISALK